MKQCLCISLVSASILSFAVVDTANADAFAAAADGQGYARAIGEIVGPEQGLQTDIDEDTFGDTPTDARVFLQDSLIGIGEEVEAEATVRGQFDWDVMADAAAPIPGESDPVFGSAGLDNPFVDPIVPVPFLVGFAELKVGGGSIGDGVITIEGEAEYNENGFVELAALDVGPANLAEVANIVATAGSVGKAEFLDLLPEGVEVLGKFREFDLLPEPGAGTFTEQITTTGIVPQDKLLLFGVAHAVGAVPEPSAAALALLGLASLGVVARKRTIAT